MSMGDDAGGVIHCSTIVKSGNVNTDRPAWTHWGIPKGLYSAEELKAAGIEVREDDNMPTLRRGNKGEAVEELQALLNAKFGFDLEIDGDFGRATETAVKEFQKKNGLTADGIVGKKTWSALGVTAPCHPEQSEETPSAEEHFADVGNTSETAPGDTVAVDRTTLKALYAQAISLAGILRKIIEGTDTDG
jgi:hypothetical protein